MAEAIQLTSYLTGRNLNEDSVNSEGRREPAETRVDQTPMPVKYGGQGLDRWRDDDLSRLASSIARTPGKARERRAPSSQAELLPIVG